MRSLQLRAQLQIELATLQRQIGITFIYVTHDQHEAFTMSDRIGVMREGRLMQVGGPRELYEQPNSVEVARFVGAANLIQGRVISRGVVEVGSEKFISPDSAPDKSAPDKSAPERSAPVKFAPDKSESANIEFFRFALFRTTP